MLGDVRTALAFNLARAAVPLGRLQTRAAQHKHGLRVLIWPAYVAGLVNPAAVELQPYGWMLIVMHYNGCFGSNCTLQVCLPPPAIMLLCCS